MARGGKREGAGRKKGGINRSTEAAREMAAQLGVTPLEFMLAHMNNPEAPMPERLDMAKAAAPYIHAKLSSIEMKADIEADLVHRIELVAVPSDNR